MTHPHDNDEASHDEPPVPTNGAPREPIIHPMQLSKSYSGKILVIFFVVLLVAYAGLKLVIGPMAMQRAGVAGDLNRFDKPDEPVTFSVSVDHQLVPGYDDNIAIQATWDDTGIVVDVSKDGKRVRHEYLVPNALETLWLIDAPDIDGTRLVVAAVPDDFARLKLVLEDETFAQIDLPATRMPARFGAFVMPSDKTIGSINPLNVRGWAAGEAYCGRFVALREVEGRRWGADQPATDGGCVVPFDK